jgi:hypothetical protein
MDASMSWERRRKGRFYYAATRRDGRVVKKYMGRGPVAELSALQADVARAKRDAEADALRAEKKRLDGPERLVEVLDRECTLVMAASLMAAGFRRQNYGPWRKQRRERNQ